MRSKIACEIHCDLEIVNNWSFITIRSCYFQILLNHTDLHNWDPIIYIWFVFHWLAMSHSCYNPVIYCYMNARFRVGFLQVLYFIPGVRRCGCIRPFARGRSSSLRTAMALTGKLYIDSIRSRFIDKTEWKMIFIQ